MQCTSQNIILLLLIFFKLLNLNLNFREICGCYLTNLIFFRVNEIFYDINLLFLYPQIRILVESDAMWSKNNFLSTTFRLLAPSGAIRLSHMNHNSPRSAKFNHKICDAKRRYIGSHSDTLSQVAPLWQLHVFRRMMSFL